MGYPKSTSRLRSFSAILVVAIFAGCIHGSAGASAGDQSVWWPLIGHDLANSGYCPTTVPESGDILWQASAAGDPVVVDRKVLVEQGNRLVCLDSITGELLWQHQPSFYYHEMSGPPAVSGDHVYVGYSGYYPGALACLDLETGSEVWSVPAPSGGWWYSVCYNPVVVGDRLIYKAFGSHDMGYGDQCYYVICRDRINGALMWYKWDSYTGFSHFVVGEERAIYLEHEGALQRWDLATGDLVWENDEFSLSESPVYYNKKLYVNDNSGLLCYDGGDGHLVWNYLAEGTNQPAIVAGRLYTGMRDGRFLCLDTETGDEIWARLYDYGYYPSPTVGIDRVLMIRLDEALYCLDAGTGDELWSIPFNGSGFSVRPIILASGKIYAYNESQIVCIGAPDPPTVLADMTCQPETGTLPFGTSIQISLINLVPDQSRTMATSIDVTLGDGTVYTNWRSGSMTIDPGDGIENGWWQTIPDYPQLLGLNQFRLIVMDVTEPPYNQPPYLPDGDTDSAECQVVGIGQ